MTFYVHVTVFIVGFLPSPSRVLPAMRPISLLSVMTLYLATCSASIMSEQQPMRDAPIRTSWEYTDCGLWFNAC